MIANRDGSATARFDDVYDKYVRGGQFFETHEHYDQFRDRYRNTLRWIERVLAPGRWSGRSTKRGSRSCSRHWSS